MTDYKKDDIVRWSYSQQHIDSLKYKSDLYWAKSCIAVFDGEKFVDTFWHGRDNFRFRPEEIGEKFEVKYVGNFADLDKQNDYLKFEDLIKYYKESDIVNLNHSNDSRGNLYLAKGAKRSLAKIKDELEYHIQQSQNHIDHLNRNLDKDKETLINLSEDNIKNIYF